MEAPEQFAPDAGGQPAAGAGIPEAAPAGQWGNAPGTEQAPQDNAPVEPQFQFELPSGSKYRTLEDLTRGATEKDFTIERMKAQLAELQSNRQPEPQAPQIDPQQQASMEIESLQRDWENTLRNDPLFRNESPETIAVEARIQALGEYRSRQAQQTQFQKYQEQQQAQAQQAEFRAFVERTPELQSSLAMEVADKYLAQGFRFPNPQVHLDLVHAEMARRGIPLPMRQQPMPQAGATTGVQGALQSQQRPLFGYAGGTGAVQGQTYSPRVQAAIQEGISKFGNDPQAIARITQRAIENESRFNR